MQGVLPNALFLACYRPLPAAVPQNLATLRSDAMPIDPRTVSCEWGTQLAGGFGGARVGFEAEFVLEGEQRRTGWLERSLECRPFAHLEIYTGSGAKIYEGRRSKATYVGPFMRSIEAQGYGTGPLEDLPLTSVPALQTAGQGVARYALANGAPSYQLADVSQFQDPGVTHNLSEYADQTPTQVFDQLTKQGGAVNALFDFTVYAGRTARLSARVAPAQPLYRLPLDESVTTVEDDTQLWSGIVLTYTEFHSGASKSVTATNPLFVQTYGLSRVKVVQGGTLTDVAAAQFCATWLALHGVPWKSITVSRGPERGMELFAGGAQRPHWYTQAQQWAMVGSDGPFICVSTSHQAHAGTMTAQFSQPESGFPALLAALEQTNVAVRRNTSVHTGAPAASATGSVRPVGPVAVGPAGPPGVGLLSGFGAPTISNAPVGSIYTDHENGNVWHSTAPGTWATVP